MSMFDLSEMRVALSGRPGPQSVDSTFDLAELRHALPRNSQSSVETSVSNTRILQKTSCGMVRRTRNIITVRKPQVILEDLLSNAPLGAITLPPSALYYGPSQSCQQALPERAQDQKKDLCFETFRQLPMEILERIWLLSIPARTLHATDHTLGRMA